MGGSCGAGRVSNGNLRSGESGDDRQDDREKAQEVRQQVLGGGQSRADRDGSEDSRVQLFQGDVPLCLPEEPRAKSTLSSRHKQWRRLPQRLQQQVLQPRLLLSFVQLDAKNKIYTILSLFLSIFYHLCISAHFTVFQDYFF